MSNEYNTEKANHYTKELLQLAQERWGDVPLTVKTLTWADGTVSVKIHHNAPIPKDLRANCQLKLQFHEDGFRDATHPQLREVGIIERLREFEENEVFHEQELLLNNITMYGEKQ